MKIKKVACVLYMEQVEIIGSDGVKHWSDVRTVSFFWHYIPWWT
jgi:hypothetical protein